jgi:tripartite ATP-independent transporter DctM subunit
VGEREIIGLLGLVAFFVLLILRSPVGLAMIGIGIVGNYALSIYVPYLRFEPYLKQFKALLWSNMANYDLSVLPLFVLMGYLASQSRLSTDLFRGLEALMSRFRGGVAMAAVGACGGFGAVCGSSLATAATMGKVALPELTRLKYSPRLATGALAAGGTLGILIPPSIALVIYAVIVEASILQMFQAALAPGLLAVAGFILTITVILKIRPGLAPEPSAMPAAERRLAIRRMLPVLLIFGGIILGLGLGLFTPTPAAGLGVFVVLVYGFALRHFTGEGLSVDGLRAALRDTAGTSGMIYLILFGAEVLKGFFSRAGLPAAIAEWASVSALDPWIILIAMLVLLIILGCFMESLAMIVVVVPFFWPILSALNGGDYASADSAVFGMGADDLKIWFGVLALIVVELGLITPPVGLNVYIISALSDGVPMSETFKGVLPFLGAEVIRVSLILLVPGLALLVPHWLAG